MKKRENDRGDFYIFLSSKDSLRFHPGNKGYNFTVELPERVELRGNWKVALCDIFLNEKNIRDPHGFFRYLRL